MFFAGVVDVQTVSDFSFKIGFCFHGQSFFNLHILSPQHRSWFLCGLGRTPKTNDNTKQEELLYCEEGELLPYLGDKYVVMEWELWEAILQSVCHWDKSRWFLDDRKKNPLNDRGAGMNGKHNLAESTLCFYFSISLWGTDDARVCSFSGSGRVSEHKPTLKKGQRPCNWYYWESPGCVNERMKEYVSFMGEFNISVGRVTFHSPPSLTERPAPRLVPTGWLC